MSKLLELGIGTTIICMLVVFFVLIMLSYVIKLQSAVLKNVKNKDKQKAESASKEPVYIEKTTEEDDDELIAVISAAVAAALGKSITRIKVMSIKRIEPNAPSWAVVGRQEQMSQKF